MEKRLKLPVGVEDFKEIRQEDFYYIDKTGLIEQLLTDYSKVSLFTRPRRFGKSLNMSMLQNFFEKGCDEKLFAGLKISEDRELCEKYMGQFPVLSITLKGVEGRSFQEAVSALKNIIGTEALRFPFLAESKQLSENERAIYQGYVKVENGVFAMAEEALPMALKNLSMLLAKHYGKPVIVLVDEYDVPLDKAFQNGYYEPMAAMLRSILGNVLKTNPSLKFAVLTGCLRITKESIFTGMNNLKVYSITNVSFDEYFGFTDAEVRELLSYYGLEKDYQKAKEWYDGYHFGNEDVYCPWDMINYCADRLQDQNLMPQNYWLNTSGNDIVKRFIYRAGAQTRDELERLIAGESISKEIHQELTYQELDTSIENLWSVLFITGYLTQKEQIDTDHYKLAIPNEEIRGLFIQQIREWFKESTRKNSGTLQCFCDAFVKKNVDTLNKLFNDYLWNMISVRDNATKEKKENFYHGILLGLLRYREDWILKSNAESGNGYSDILIEIPESRMGIVIELKYAENGKLKDGCVKALQQIEEKKYADGLREDGMRTIIKYGIACYKKECLIVLAI